MPQHEDLKDQKRFCFMPKHEAEYDEHLNKHRLDAASGQAKFFFEDFLNECAEDDIDAHAVAYVLWIQLTHFLVYCGAPPARLIRDCVWHSEEETVAGHA